MAIMALIVVAATLGGIAIGRTTRRIEVNTLREKAAELERTVHIKDEELRIRGKRIMQLMQKEVDEN